MLFALIFSFILFFILQLPNFVLDCFFKYLNYEVRVLRLLYNRISIFIITFIFIIFFWKISSYEFDFYDKAFLFCKRIEGNFKMSLFVVTFILISYIGFHLTKIFCKMNKIIPLTLFILQTVLICIISIYFSLSAIGSWISKEPCALSETSPFWTKRFR